METRPFCGLLVLLAGLFLGSRAQAQCSSEERFQGRVQSVDLAQGQFLAGNNLVTTTFLFAVDGQTAFNGAAGSLAQLRVGDDVDLRYCFPSTPRRVLRMTTARAAVPPAAALVVDLDLAPAQQIVPVTRVFGDDPSEGLGGFSGQGMAFGDVNGDGFSDVLLRGGRSPIPTSRALVVLYGGPDAAGADIDLDTNGAVSGAGETRIHATRSFQSLGSALGCGDLDGDGLDDLILGQDGGVHVVFGAADLPGTLLDLDPEVTAPGQFRLLTGQLPPAVTAGDLNADGYDDLVADARTRGIFVVYGGPGLRGSTLDLRTVVGPVAGVTRILPTQPISSLASGDVNGDGFADLVLGATRTIDPVLTCAVVIYGSEALVGTLADLATNPATGFPRETRVTGRSLSAVACADFNGDGFDDVCLAGKDVPGPGDNFAVGEVNVIYGATTLPGSSLSLLTGSVNANETRLTGREEFGEFGHSLAAADLDGDGLADLLMGAPGAVPFKTLPETNVRSDGALYGLRGRTGLAGTWLIDPREVSDLYVFAADPNDRLGSVAAAGGDMDRDGLPEYAVSSSAGSNPSLGAGSFAGYAALPFLHGVTLRPTVSMRRFSRAGDGPGGAVVPPVDFGPVVRVTIDYSDEDLAQADWTTVTLARSGLPGTARVMWRIESARSGWQEARVTLRYTDAEIAGLAEGRLGVLRADTLAGPFQRVPSRLDARGNAVTARVDRLGVFVLVELPRGPVAHDTPTRVRSVQSL